MTPTLKRTEISALVTTGSAFLPLAATRDTVIGLQITPVLVYLNAQLVPEASSRCPSLASRTARLAASPKRTAALKQGRKRLAAVIQNQNDGAITLAGLRLAAGLSQRELAEKLGTQQPNVARMEKRGGDVTVSTVRALAKALEVSAAQVLSAIATTEEFGLEQVS